MKIYCLLILILLGAGAGYGQAKSCSLQLEVYKFKPDSASEQFTVKNENVVLKNTNTQKKISAASRREPLFFAALPAAKYETTVSFPGYKSTLKTFDLDCSVVNEQNTATEVVFLWAGDSKEKMRMDLGTRGVKDGDGFSFDPKSNAALADAPGAKVVAPAYPRAAHAVHASGAVRVQVLIDELGRVVSATALDGHPLLRQASEKAARKSRFATTLLDGIPVKIAGVIVYNFVAQ